MAVYCYEENDDGTGSPIYGRPGELVCTKPFPSMPVYFWNDEDDLLYKKAYFCKFPGRFNLFFYFFNFQEERPVVNYLI